MHSAQPKRTQQDQTDSDQQRMGKKAYAAPAILHELALETRAGSTFSVDPLGAEMDLLNVFNKGN